MTCIAWDGKTLAADKRGTNGGLPRTVTKIRRIDNLLVGACGTTAGVAEAFRWVELGRLYENYPAILKDKEDGPDIVVIEEGKIKRYSESPVTLEYEDKLFAMGSGRDYAMAAMHLGKTAKEAVEIACLFDTACGNGVDVLEL